MIRADVLQTLPAHVVAVVRARVEGENTAASQHVLASIVHVDDPALLSPLVDFYGFLAQWIMHIIDRDRIGCGAGQRCRA